jgi:hypothetical protein
MKILFTLIALSLAQVVIACSCFPILTFCETLTYNENAIVIRGKISSRNNEKNMVVKIESLLYGSTDQSNVTIESGNGADCGVFTQNFKKGESYIMLIRGNQISNCGISFLQITNEKVQGAIKEKVTSIKYDDFLNLPGCGILSKGLFSIGVYPNPFPTNLVFYSDFDESQNVDYTIYDIMGRIVLSGNKTINPGKTTTTINVQKLSSGVYILNLSSIQTKRQLRIIKS